MVIKGIERMYPADLHYELQRGGRFVTYDYCISPIVVTVRQSSDIYFVRAGESAFMKGLQYTLLTLLAGWWGFPFGPIFTVVALVTNFQGGRDVTAEVANALLAPPPPAYAPY